LLPNATIKIYRDAGQFLFHYYDEFAADVTAFLDSAA